MEHEWYTLPRLRGRKQLSGIEQIPVKADRQVAMCGDHADSRVSRRVGGGS